MQMNNGCGLKCNPKHLIINANRPSQYDTEKRRVLITYIDCNDTLQVPTISVLGITLARLRARVDSI